MIYDLWFADKLYLVFRAFYQNFSSNRVLYYRGFIVYLSWYRASLQYSDPEVRNEIIL